MGAISGAAAYLLAYPATAAAQCIMCYLSASSSGERGAQVLRLGIIVLAVPTLLTFAGVFLLAYRRRNPAEWQDQPKEESLPASHEERDTALPIPAGQQSHSPSVF
ncbi:MAG: hypothetical protein HY316_03800 [Acidobacteria bacterium]|nr:hypothetical protein [Acidobacteriota bacterium]